MPEGNGTFGDIRGRRLGVMCTMRCGMLAHLGLQRPPLQTFSIFFLLSICSKVQRTTVKTNRASSSRLDGHLTAKKACKKWGPMQTFAKTPLQKPFVLDHTKLIISNA